MHPSYDSAAYRTIWLGRDKPQFEKMPFALSPETEKHRTTKVGVKRASFPDRHSD